MANLYNISIFILFLGGFLGWSLFFYSIFQAVCSRKKEIDLIKEIKKDLESVKEDVSKLK